MDLQRSELSIILFTGAFAFKVHERQKYSLLLITSANALDDQPSFLIFVSIQRLQFRVDSVFLIHLPCLFSY